MNKTKQNLINKLPGTLSNVNSNKCACNIALENYLRERVAKSTKQSEAHNDKIKEIEKWTSRRTKIATKNALRDKTCDKCEHHLYCKLVNNKFFSCYLFKAISYLGLNILQRAYPTLL